MPTPSSQPLPSREFDPLLLEEASEIAAKLGNLEAECDRIGDNQERVDALNNARAYWAAAAALAKARAALSP